MYLIEIKTVIDSWRRSGEKRGGEKMKESLAMLMKTNGGNMSDYRSLAMLLKTQDLPIVSGDVDEKTWG